MKLTYGEPLTGNRTFTHYKAQGSVQSSFLLTWKKGHGELFGTNTDFHLHPILWHGWLNALGKSLNAEDKNWRRIKSEWSINILCNLFDTSMKPILSEAYLKVIIKQLLEDDYLQGVPEVLRLDKQNPFQLPYSKSHLKDLVSQKITMDAVPKELQLPLKQIMGLSPTRKLNPEQYHLLEDVVFPIMKHVKNVSLEELKDKARKASPKEGIVIFIGGHNGKSLKMNVVIPDTMELFVVDWEKWRKLKDVSKASVARKFQAIPLKLQRELMREQTLHGALLNPPALEL